MPVAEATIRRLRPLWGGALPRGWRYARFAEALEKVRRPVEIHDETIYAQPVIRRRHGGIEIRERQLGSAIKTKAQFRIRTNDWLMSKVQILHGAYGVVPPAVDGAIASGTYYAFRARDEVDLRFFWYLSHLFAFHRSCELSSVGVVIEKMVFRVDDWLRFEFPLPPLPEQRKIAAILSSVDDAIAKTEAVVAQTRRVKEGLLQDLLTRGIGPDGKPHARLKKTPIGEIPEGWEVVRLGDVLESVVYGTNEPAKGTEKDVPILRIPNVQSGQIDLSDLKFISPSAVDLTRYGAQPGSILVIRTNGNPRIVGRCAVVPEGLGDIAYASYLIALTTRHDRLLPSFAAAFINSGRGRLYIDRRTATSAGNYNVNSTQLRSMPIGLPGVEEQQRIMHRVQASRSAGIRNEEALESLKALKSGLLQDLLTGKTRVSV